MVNSKEKTKKKSLLNYQVLGKLIDNQNQSYKIEGYNAKIKILICWKKIKTKIRDYKNTAEERRVSIKYTCRIKS